MESNGQYHKSKKVCLKCPGCHKKICGISKSQAEAMLKEHARSTVHKEIIEALKKEAGNKKK